MWAGATLGTDALARELMDTCGLGRATLQSWLDDNPVVTLGGQTDKVFDLTEEKDSGSVLEMCRQ